MSATTTRVDLGSREAFPTYSAPLEAATDTTATKEERTSSYATYVSIEYMQRMWILRAVSRTFLAPLDRVKFVMQTQKELIRHGTLTREFSSAWECARHLSVIEGNRSFWRGNLIQVVALLPIALAQVFIALPVQSFIFESFPVHSALYYTVASYAALLGGALAASLLSYPLEFARFRLAVDVKPRRDAPYAFKHSLAFFSQPVLSEFTPYLYRGLTLYVLGSFVYQTVYQVLLQLLAPYVPPAGDDAEGDLSNTEGGGGDGRGGWGPVLVQTGASLAVAGGATLCLHPVDLVRRRVMLAVTEDRLRYPSAMDCVRRIAQREGVRGFYRGGAVTLIRMVFATGLVLVGLPY